MNQMQNDMVITGCFGPANNPGNRHTTLIHALPEMESHIAKRKENVAVHSEDSMQFFKNLMGHYGQRSNNMRLMLEGKTIGANIAEAHI
jgi:hypothetical protein